MSGKKPCRIYYARIVERPEPNPYEENLGQTIIEPLYETPNGSSDPDFCCPDFEALYKNSARLVKYGYIEHLNRPALYWAVPPLKELHFCPFCGAEVVFVQHLKLREIYEVDPQPRYKRRWEEAK